MARWSIEMYKKVRQNAKDTCKNVKNYVEAHDNNGFFVLHGFENTITQFGLVCEAIGRIDEAIASLELDGSPKVSEYQVMKADLERYKQNILDILAHFSKTASGK